MDLLPITKSELARLEALQRVGGRNTDHKIMTQLQHALDKLGIELICEAKGRVERVNRTFQDRLIKTMRLRGISTIEAASDFLPAFIAAHNNRFAVPPAVREDAHRSAKGSLNANRLAAERSRGGRPDHYDGDGCWTEADESSGRRARQLQNDAATVGCSPAVG